MTAGEAIGFAFPAVAGVLWADTPGGWSAIIAAGAVEGAILGLAQWRVMRDDVPALRASTWTTMTALGAASAYVVAYLMVTFGVAVYELPVYVQLVIIAAAGGTVLGAVGAAQGLVLRRVMPYASLWTVGTAAAWLLGLGLFFTVAPPLWHEGQSAADAILIGMLGGVVMAFAVAVVTGAVWGQLSRARAEDPGHPERSARCLAEDVDRRSDVRQQEDEPTVDHSAGPAVSRRPHSRARSSSPSTRGPS